MRLSLCLDVSELVELEDFFLCFFSTGLNTGTGRGFNSGRRSLCLSGVELEEEPPEFNDSQELSRAFLCCRVLLCRGGLGRERAGMRIFLPFNSPPSR